MKHFTNMMTSISTDPKRLLTRWEEIAGYKERFLKNNEDPRGFPCLNAQIAESWMQSRSYGVDPYTKKIGRKLEPELLKVVMVENKLLVDIAVPLINAFKPLLNVSGYMLTIHNHNGTLIYIDGSKDAVSTFGDINVKVGWVWNEETSGTTAHSLSMAYKCPVQLIGPENYCVALYDNISSASPILNENGEVISTLVLVQALKNIPDFSENYLQNMQYHTLGWITSMCMAIEAQLKLENRNLSLNIINNTLETTISCIGEGLLTIDKSNKIRHINKKCALMLGIKAEKARDRDITKILGEHPVITETLKNKEEKESEITVENQRFWLSVKPVLSGNLNQINGAVIRLQDISKINALATQRFGASAKYSFESIIGNSQSIEKAKEKAKKFAKTSDNILLIGESGTGKELFAQSIHNEYRPQGPFVALNCAAMPRNLIESELFGYVGGTFTGADKEGRPGKIELAHGGTLFLDEIGDMPFEIQAVLLRVLDTKQVMRLGGKQYINVDFRLIAATHKDLQKMTSAVQFRHDLYYRLSVLKILIPPLREREEDVLKISQHLIHNYCRRMGYPVLEISGEVERIIMKNSWPGNVRQLENAITHAINLAQDEKIIKPEHLPEEIVNNFDGRKQHNEPDAVRPILPIIETVSVKEAEKIAIKNVLLKTGNDVAQAAKILEMGKSTLYRKLKRYNLS